MLARVHASAVSRMENLGRTARWTPATINRVAVLPLVAGELLKWLWPCGVVGPGSSQHLPGFVVVRFALLIAMWDVVKCGPDAAMRSVSLNCVA